MPADTQTVTDKRFLLFAGAAYYPARGIDTLVAAYASAEDARAHVEIDPDAAAGSGAADYDWAQVVEVRDGTLVKLFQWETSLYGGSGVWEPANR